MSSLEVIPTGNTHDIHLRDKFGNYVFLNYWRICEGQWVNSEPCDSSTRVSPANILTVLLRVVNTFEWIHKSHSPISFRVVQLPMRQSSVCFTIYQWNGRESYGWKHLLDLDKTQQIGYCLRNHIEFTERIPVEWFLIHLDLALFSASLPGAIKKKSRTMRRTYVPIKK